jgi:DNA repair exonuclease SbcCD ATPase subunit
VSDSSSDRSQVLRAAAARKHQDTVQRAERAIRQLVKEGRPVTFTAVAEHAPCSTAFLYGHAELKRRITHLREQHRRATLPIPPVDPDTPSSVVRTLTLQIAALKRHHRDELAQLRQDLAAAHGEILALRRKLGEQRR